MDLVWLQCRSDALQTLVVFLTHYLHVGVETLEVVLNGALDGGISYCEQIIEAYVGLCLDLVVSRAVNLFDDLA